MSRRTGTASPPLRFTGQTLVFNGKTKFEYPAASGNRKHAPIPAGTYWIVTDEVYENGPGTDYMGKTLAAILTLSLRSTIEQKHYGAWGRFRIPIHQSEEQQRRTGRTGMFIHGGSAFGSAGCIDLAEWIDVFVDQLRKEYPSGERAILSLFVE